MDKRVMKLGWLILILSFLYGCASIEIRSPIVFKKSKPEEPPVSSKTASVPPTPKESGITEETPVSPAPTSQAGEVVVKGEPVPGGIAVTEKSSAEGYRTNILSPATIPILSAQDLAAYKFSVLGSVEVKSPSKEGFTQEKAIQNLKVEAFKRYGALAQGITNIDYKRGIPLLSAKKDLYEGISGDVVTLVKKTVVAIEEGAGTVPSGTGTPRGVSPRGESGEIPQLLNIVILSSDDLFQRNFKILGRVQIMDESRKGFTEEQAIKNLKIEAFRLYGVQAKALTRVKLIKEQRVFYYKKTRSNESPQPPKAFIKASAEVVTWSSGS